MATITTKTAKAPLLKLNFLSHGTLDSSDLGVSRRFYEEVLGLQVMQHAPGAMMLRMGSDHVYVVVENAGEQTGMRATNHNGFDVGSDAEVEAAYELLCSVKEEYGLRKIGKPSRQHGAVTFYFEDMDGNWWEIVNNPPGGYSKLFHTDGADITGLTLDEFRARNSRGRLDGLLGRN